jgi:hypothetical protein
MAENSSPGKGKSQPGGIKLFRIAGIQIAIDFSWFIIFFLIMWSLSAGYFPHAFPRESVTAYWVAGLAATLLFFASVLAHESAHLERRDHWMNLVQKLALVIFPLHPGLHLLDRWLCGERELACDEFVLRHAHAPIDYAASLVDVAAFTLNRPAISLPFGAMRSPSELSARVERILRPAPRLHPVLTVVFTAALTAGTAVLTGFALDRLPTISFEPTHPETLTVPPRSLRLAEDRDDAAAGPIRMVDAAYRAPLVSSTTHPSVSHPRRLSSVAQRFAVSSATAAGAQAYLTAWHRSADGEYGVKPMHAVQPRTRQGQTAAVEYSVVVLFTSVTSSTGAMVRAASTISASV